VKLVAVIVDDQMEVVKGALLELAGKGALVDIIYDFKGNLPWARRERWAIQIIEALNDIHSDGFIHGDFTLSNIVIDDSDNVKIIDMNRRGCPIGWEPPELSCLINRNRRISMHIGQKTSFNSE